MGLLCERLHPNGEELQTVASLFDLGEARSVVTRLFQFFFFFKGTSRTCLHSFEDRSDCVYDVAWSPSHPSLFASGDCAGRIDLWNFNSDTEVSCCDVSAVGKTNHHGGNLCVTAAYEISLLNSEAAETDA